ncbi:hypothetical protein K9M79_01045 [Candidatus Woesearchaeota archaeon]|nr:hypothetical protein [Candidatus Woesearchaeota archaeon]
MIGRAEWFTRRKYGGWGITPKTWQGWVYLFFMIVPFAVFQSIPIWQENVRIGITVGWLVFLLLDVAHIMLTLKRDERDKKIESLAERNAAWFMVIIISLGLVYQIINSVLTKSFYVDWILAVALIGGALVKTISNLVYERKAL